MKTKSKIDAKLVMLDHSIAKVKLYTNYLSTYLNILSRTPFVNKIHIYDLMCGEGIYADGSKGSPIIAMEKIKINYFSNNKSCPDMNIWFNDIGKSEIENEKYKIDRVKENCSKIFQPPNVIINYTKSDYSEISLKVIEDIKSFKAEERLLLFIDPYGYKEIKIEQIKNYLAGGKTELILFLPISFMSRVANKSLSEEYFSGGEPLRELLLPLFEIEKNLKACTKPYPFIIQLKRLLRKYLIEDKIFVDTYTIERDEQNVYCLFFFTPNALGFEKMLDTKWKMDEEQGKGFRIDSEQGSLFEEIEISDYPNELKEKILTGSETTNSDLYLFGLENGFLPKHTNKILREWQKNNSKLKVYLEDGKEARKNSFYNSYKNFGPNPEKVVKFIFEGV